MTEDIDEIIAAEINGTASDSQKRFINEWMKADPSNAETHHHITAFLTSKYIGEEIINQEEIRDQIWRKVGKGSSSKTRTIFHHRFSKAAAVVLILIASSLVLFNLMTEQSAKIENENSNLVEKTTLPGVKSTIHLPDGSKIILNSSSKISYVEKFADSVRWVKLEGEAYFDVAKNPDKPFIVQSGDIQTKAIGTSFNIKSNLSQCVVSLVEGVVAVKQINSPSTDEGILLNQGEYISYSGSRVLGKGNFDIKEVTGWKQGLLVFRGDNFDTVKQKLENWYGVQISFSGQVPKWSLNGTYDNDNLENILKILSHSQNFEYEMSGNNIKIVL